MSGLFVTVAPGVYTTQVLPKRGVHTVEASTTAPLLVATVVTTQRRGGGAARHGVGHLHHQVGLCVNVGV